MPAVVFPDAVPDLRLLRHRFFPHGYLDAVWQVALFLLVYYAYRLARGAVDGRAATAFQHGRDVISLERATHTFIEPSVQAWTTSTGWLIDVTSYMYVHFHFTLTVSALVYIYLFHNRSFYFVRNVLAAAMIIALIGYVVFPTAPPRFFPEWGFTDSVAQFTGVPDSSATVNALFNPFAAVPSIHVCFALILGWSLIRLVRPWWAKAFWAVYPLIMTFVVISTGNHFWFDAFTGALTAGVSALIATTLLARVRPDVWTFEPRSAVAARAEATA
jgi:PAP2 superfamily